ncbi:uncharacterized protein LOC125680661 [Ostrea edulis]|uniref:uncharacterized protein LOC125680661 n=1 Tax=Ostrea edulis TaxID=37623 RepID=UPI0020957FE7|nr:uncharacterized protein LOC125680661 [Ostrea edulis]XP_048776317.1 uncharacterized protein LOC125680661 [Ostrea edulis]XP_048776318.1 uncharacterized protein LOC125680661 [Ostrea edulis]
MSTTAEFVDGANFVEAINSVRNDNTDDRYVLVEHVEENPNKLTVLRTGQDPADIVNYLEESQAMYALARYESTFDMSNTIKFVYFRWMGDRIPVGKKGRYGVVHGSIEEKFNPFHLVVETSSREDFDTDKILQQLEENTGKKSKVLETKTPEMQERGFTNSQLPQKKAPQSAVAAPGVAKIGGRIDITSDVMCAIGDVRKDDNDTRWMLAEYETSKGPVTCTGKGSGDISELKEMLDDAKVMYGLYRVTDTVDDITTVKFVYIGWVGCNVKPMMKAKISTNKGIIEENFAPFHVNIFATELSDLSEKIAMDKVTAASGTMSHVR